MEPSAKQQKSSSQSTFMEYKKYFLFLQPALFLMQDEDCKWARFPGSKYINNTLQDTGKVNLLWKLCRESLENNQGVKWQVIKEESMKATVSAKKQQTNKELEHC